jgi:ribosome biogenesis GTPase
MKNKTENSNHRDYFESNQKLMQLDGFSIALVISEQKGIYNVKDADGEYLAKITGKQIYEASSREDYPAVGDWVAITKLNENQATIHKILPRKTIIKRKYNNKNEIQVIATNIDIAFIVESINRDYNLNRIERYFAIANNGNVKPTIILNKIDLISEEELNLKKEQIKERFPDTDLILTSTINESGLNELKKYITKNKIYCFLGSSGVGKSSLINKLLNKETIKTEDISSYSDRGKHATTNRQMYFLKNGGIVIDNPGIREVGMTDTNTGINNIFDEITELATKCKYTDCTHINETECAVLSALKSGKINKDKYSNYINLKKEAEYYEMTKFEKRKKDRQFGKLIKRTKKKHKKYNS